MVRRIGLVAALLLVIVLAACDTQPATNVTASSAALNAKGACTAGISGEWWFQMRNYSHNSGWWDATPRYGYSCSQNTGEVNFEPKTVGGLSPGNTYQFRLAVTVNGNFYWYDANGTQNGGVYDSFRTLDISGVEDVSGDPPQENDCSTDGTTACGSAAIGTYPNFKKVNLPTKMLWVFGNGTPAEFKISQVRTLISWGYNVETKNIRWINKKVDWICWVSLPGSVCDYQGGDWIVEYCDRSGVDTCLFRHQDKFHVSFTAGFVFNRYLISCEGTRIWADLGQNHRRNAFEGACNPNPLAKYDPNERPPVGNGDLTVGEGKNAVKVGRWLKRHQLDRLDGACLTKGATLRGCKRVALKLYRGLPDRVKAKIVGSKARPMACAALSPEALYRLDPDSPCARRT